MNILEYEYTQETKNHGNLGFPFNIYPCSIPLDFISVPIHWHNDMEIIFIKKGKGRVLVDLKPYTVNAGDIILVCPGQLHSIEQLGEYAMEYENIIFQLSMLMTSQGDLCTDRFFYPLLHNHIILPVYIHAGSPEYETLFGCLNKIDNMNKGSFAPNEKDALSALAVKSCLFEFFFLIFSHHKDTDITKSRHKSMDTLKAVLKYVETNFHMKISIEDMAKLCGFSNSHFIKFFKSSMGISFIEYLNNYRLSMAARMLSVSSDTVLSIAEETGFDNLSYFNRLFKRKYGMTPSMYRKSEEAVLNNSVASME